MVDTLAKAKIAARLIYKGKASIDDYTPEEQVLIRQAYKLIYGTDLPE